MGDLPVAEAVDGSRPKIVILGCGAIGGVLGGSLARAGRDVTVVDGWFQHVEATRADGLSIEGPEERFTVSIDALHIDQMSRLERPADVLIISPKCYDTELMVRLGQPWLADNGCVISAQNGVMEEWLPSWLPANRVVGCVVRTAGELTAPGNVVRYLGRGWPALTLGELDGTESERVRSLVKLLAPAGEIRTTTNVWGELWSKLAQNLTASPAGGVTGFSTRLLWSDPTLVDVAIALAGECITVAETLGHHVEPIFGYIPAAQYRAAHEGIEEARKEVIGAMNEMAAQRVGGRENTPSLLHDIRKSRRTENDYLSGHVLRHARSLGLEAPANARMADLVHRVESGRLAPDHKHVDLIARVLTD